jgi:hypothetical protein
MMATSTDGVAWTAVGTNPFTTSISGIVYGGGKFVAFGGEMMATSTDGADWTEVADTGFVVRRPNGQVDVFQIYGITYGGGKFVAFGEDGHISYSNPQE